MRSGSDHNMDEDDSNLIYENVGNTISINSDFTEPDPDSEYYHVAKKSHDEVSLTFDEFGRPIDVNAQNPEDGPIIPMTEVYTQIDEYTVIEDYSSYDSDEENQAIRPSLGDGDESITRTSTNTTGTRTSTRLTADNILQQISPRPTITSDNISQQTTPRPSVATLRPSFRKSTSINYSGHDSSCRCSICTPSGHTSVVGVHAGGSMWEYFMAILIPREEYALAFLATAILAIMLSIFSWLMQTINSWLAPEPKCVRWFRCCY